MKWKIWSFELFLAQVVMLDRFKNFMQNICNYQIHFFISIGSSQA